jgi:hypothetical protein
MACRTCNTHDCENKGINCGKTLRKIKKKARFSEQLWVKSCRPLQLVTARKEITYICVKYWAQSARLWFSITRKESLLSRILYYSIYYTIGYCHEAGVQPARLQVIINIISIISINIISISISIIIIIIIIIVISVSSSASSASSSS